MSAPGIRRRKFKQVHPIIDQPNILRQIASMSKTYKVAVVGATGVVGREMMNVLEERTFPVSELVPLDSPRTAEPRRLVQVQA